MGLDGVELVMEFEDEFGISIPDEMASQIVSVGDTVKCIVGILSRQAPLSGVCTSAHSFYLLRRELVRRYGLPRELVELDARVSSLIPPKNDRDWPDIAAASGLRPARRYGFGNRTPRQANIREILETQCRKGWRNSHGAIDEEPVFQLVREIVAQQFGMPVENIRRESRYIDDLGMS
jgi:acyl carrier protein